MKKYITYFILIALVLHFELLCVKSKTVVAIQPFESVDRNTIDQVRSGILKFYNVEVIILPHRKLPEQAYYKEKSRYRAEKILHYLRNSVDVESTKILGLTDKDISTTKGDIYDWGIFGLGSLGGRSCVVSTFRLHRGKSSEQHYFNRLVKVVNHELGHTFGLDHCPDKFCLMQDARGTIKTIDTESEFFCSQCQETLKDIVRLGSSEKDKLKK